MVTKPLERLNSICFLLCVFLSVALILWKCHFGVDFTDEAYSIVPGWKLLPLGERLFEFEVFNAPRQFDLLNYLLVQPFVKFSVLSIRLSGAFFFALTLGAYFGVCFKRRVGLIAGLLYFALLNYDTVLIPGWSYNWWARNLLLLEAVFLFLSFQSHFSYQKVTLVLAGLMGGLAALAYLPLIGTSFFVVVGMMALLLMRSHLRTSLASHAVVFYLLGIALVWVPNLFYIYGVFPRWLHAYHALSSLSIYSGVTSFSKLWGLLHWIFQTPEFWFSLVFMMVLNPFFPGGEPTGQESHLPAKEWLSKLKKKGAKFYPALQVLLFVWSVGHIGLRFFYISDGFETMRTFAGVGMAGALYLFAMGLWHHKGEYVLGSLLYVATFFIMGLASASEKGATIWAAPLILVPCFSVLFAPLPLPFQSVRKEDFWMGRYTYLMGLLLCLVFVKAALWRQLHLSYFDVPPAQASMQIESGPLGGLWTSKRRAYLSQLIEQHTQGADFILAYPFVAGALYFGEAKHAVDTLAVQENPGIERRIESLKFMGKRQRFPQVVVRLKQRAWTWGNPMNFNSGIELPIDDPYSKYVACVKEQTLVEVDEFEIVQTSKEKGPRCLKSAL